MFKPIRRSSPLLLAWLVCLPSMAGAQPPADLSQATLEELLSLEVTSAGRRTQRAEDVAAAVYVISRDDIRSSGLTLLPEILRLAPGVQVAQVNANKWAVSVRGFNSVYSNKLLILVDGRSLYNRSFSGVFWDAQDLDVASIERIEILRGPGGAMWGANAVNGVINIITQSARVSTGGAIDVSLGTFEHGRARLRYGGPIGRASYRLFGQWSGYGAGVAPDGDDAGDRWQSISGGYRVDWADATQTMMTQGHYTASRSRPDYFQLVSFAPDVYSTEGVGTRDELSALVRWTRTAPDGAVLQAQGYTTHTRHDESTLESVERMADLDVQYERPLATRHVLVLGGGYRYVDLETQGSLTVQLAPEDSHIVNAFAQDEFELAPGLRLTAGARLDYESIGGLALSPSARAIWEISPRQRLWAAVGRARRTPAATDRTLRINFGSMPTGGLPLLFAFVGNPDYGRETLVQLDGGYRVRVGATASIDVAVFRGRYDNLATSEPLDPVFEATPAPAHMLLAWQFANLMRATTTGLELSAYWAPFGTWRLDASYSTARLTPSVDAASQDMLAPLFDGNSPRHQWQLRSTTWVGRQTQLTGAIHHVGALPNLDIPAYTRVDALVEYKLGDNVTAVVAGRNLLDPSHLEFSGFASGLLGSAIPRSAHMQLRWQF